MREHPYAYKPAPKFFGDGDTYLGVELEVEAIDYQSKQDGLALRRDVEWAYAKRDGSLGPYGWEMVTHPISLKLWMSREEVREYHNIQPGTILTARYKGELYTATALLGGKVEWNGTVYNSISAAGKAIRGGKSTNGYEFFGLINGRNRTPNPTVDFFRLVESLRGIGYTSHDSGRCGFHIHISRKAFSPTGDLHVPMYYRFKCLINGDLFRRLSQRTNFQYCQQVPVTAENFSRVNLSRYCAVNQTTKTIEVRIFRGNLRENRLRKNIESVIAAIEFSRDTASMVAPLDQEYIDYVRGRSDRFANLVAYLDIIITNGEDV